MYVGVPVGGVAAPVGAPVMLGVFAGSQGRKITITDFF